LLGEMLAEGDSVAEIDREGEEESEALLDELFDEDGEVLALFEALIERDFEELGEIEADLDELFDGLIEAEGDKLGLADADIEADFDGLNDLLIEGLILPLKLIEGEREAEIDFEMDGDFEKEGDSDAEIDADFEGDFEEDGEIEAL
jgi:hypothetical protein